MSERERAKRVLTAVSHRGVLTDPEWITLSNALDETCNHDQCVSAEVMREIAKSLRRVMATCHGLHPSSEIAGIVQVLEGLLPPEPDPLDRMQTMLERQRAKETYDTEWIDGLIELLRKAKARAK